VSACDTRERTLAGQLPCNCMHAQLNAASAGAAKACGMCASGCETAFECSALHCTALSRTHKLDFMIVGATLLLVQECKPGITAVHVACNLQGVMCSSGAEVMSDKVVAKSVTATVGQFSRCVAVVCRTSSLLTEHSATLCCS
jgi:hypothetical protein